MELSDMQLRKHAISSAFSNYHVESVSSSNVESVGPKVNYQKSSVIPINVVEQRLQHFSST
jgi:hypothetical protein